MGTAFRKVRTPCTKDLLRTPTRGQGVHWTENSRAAHSKARRSFRIFDRHERNVHIPGDEWDGM